MSTDLQFLVEQIADDQARLRILVNGDEDATVVLEARTSPSIAGMVKQRLDEVSQTYYGTLAEDPTEDPSGNAPTSGDFYYNDGSVNPAQKGLRLFNGVDWEAIFADADSVVYGVTTVGDELDSLNARAVYFAATKSAADSLAAGLGDGATVITDEDEDATPAGVQTRRSVLGGALTAITSFLKTSMIAWKHGGTGAVWRTLYARLMDFPVSVKDFGAKTIQEQAGFNSTFAFVAALNYINGAGKGGELLLGGGTYYIDPLDLRPYNNIRMVGTCSQKYPYNARTVLLIASEGEIALQTVEYGTENAAYFGKGIEFKNIYLDCNNKTNYGITCKLDTVIDGVSVRRAILDGIVLVGTSYPVAIRNSASLNNGRHGLVVKAPFTTVYTIDGLECGFNGGYGAVIEDGSTSSIRGLLVQSNEQGGLKIIQPPASDYSLPVFLERLSFDTFYTEANGTLEITDPNYEGNYGLIIQGRSNDITTQAGKIYELSFVNSSVNKSSMGINSKISGTSGLRVQTSSGIALDPLTNILGIETKGGHLFPITMPEHPPLRNVLDFFEQGVRGATIEAHVGTITLASPLLVNYTVIGTLLTFSLVVSVASVTPDITGTVTITGLPYAARGASAFSIYANFMGAHDLNMQAAINQFTDAIVIRGFGAGIANTIGQYIKADTDIVISGSYTVGGR